MSHRPNILLITCDQLRFDFVGAYGCDFIQTPNIDRLAREGRLFENAYSPNPVCIPARHNLITGLGARHHGFDDMPATREADDYAMYLAQNGYGSLQSVHGVRTCLYMQPQRSLVPEEHHGSAWVADRTIRSLRENHGRKPFLIWAGFIHPHPPLDVPQRWADMYKGKVPKPTQTKTPLSALARENIQLGCLEDEAALMRVRELYAAAMSFADHQIGRILDELDALRMGDDTLVVFTSDHGEMLGDLGTFQKFLPYDASSRVPLVARYPRLLPAGTKDARFVDLNDMLPTFLDAAGLAYPGDCDLSGESILGAEGVKNRAHQYVEHQHGNKRWCSIRDERYKYVYCYGDAEQLFDLRRDPAETTNLLYLCAQEHEPVRQRLRAVLLHYEKRYGLPDCIRDGDFVRLCDYEPKPYYETNFPRFPSMMTEAEAGAMNRYEDEVLMAIRHEPLTRLESNHTAQILRTNEAFDQQAIEALLARAKAQRNS